MVVVWKIVAQVLYVPAVFQCWGEGLRWWAEGAEVFQLLWPKYAVGFFNRRGGRGFRWAHGSLMSSKEI